MRTKKPLDLFLAPCMWKLVSGVTLTVEDLEEVCALTMTYTCLTYMYMWQCPQVDLMFVRALIGIRDIDKGGVKEEEFAEVL